MQVGCKLPSGGLAEAEIAPMLNKYSGGETGIRTLGPREGTTVFETAPFDHSGTSPRRVYGALDTAALSGVQPIFLHPKAAGLQAFRCPG